MKTTKTFEIEIERNNVTPAQFLAYLRQMQKKHPEMACDFDLNWFKADNGFNFDYDHGTPETRPCASEKSVDRPYEKQTYVRNFDGSCYNEIIEFQFWDETHGYGYYYTVQVDVAEEDREENTSEYLGCVTRYCEREIERNTKKAESIREDIRENGEWMADYYISMRTAEADRLDQESEELRKIITECRKPAATTAGTAEAEKPETTESGHDTETPATDPTEGRTDRETASRAIVAYTNCNGHERRRRFDIEADALDFCSALDDRIRRGTCGGYILSALSASSALSATVTK